MTVECSSVVCSFCAIAAAVPRNFRRDLKTALRVSVVVGLLFTTVSSCVTDCNF